MNDKSSNKIDFAFVDTSTDIEQITQLKPIVLKNLPSRITLNGKVTPLIHENDYAVHIFSAITISLASEWFQSLGIHSQNGIETVLLKFIPWLNSQDINHQNCYSILKEYEAYRVNNNKIKPQSSGLRTLINILNNGINPDLIDYKNIHYLKTLIKGTVLSKEEDRVSDTLTGFFASMPWLRSVMGESDFLKLESPKRLMDSFSIVVATTLLFILESKKEAKVLIKNPQSLSNKITKIENLAVRNQHYCISLLSRLALLDKTKQPANNLTELILLDLLPSDRREEFMTIWQESNGSEISYRHPDNRKYFFTQPHIFSISNWSTHSRIEQLLCAWLCAWLAIQPNDVIKLKRNDFVISKNQHERPISVQISYYKGRSGSNQETPILDARQIEARALIAYLEQLPEAYSNLFNQPITKGQPMVFKPCTVPSRLMRLFESNKIQSSIRDNLNQRKSSPIFLMAYKAFVTHSDLSFSVWSGLQKKNGLDSSVSCYRLSVTRNLPQLMFGLGYIKNSAVHSRTDKYRDKDLVNQNSHSSITEKMHYLTDSNKEWINQNGRITRMVLLDIEHYAYRPNINAAHEKTINMSLRTRVLQTIGDAVDTNLIKINKLGLVDYINLNLDNFNHDPDDILVLDTPETVINMLHYINQAEHQYQLLITNALPFFERTVLPTVEWMYAIIQNQLSPKSVREGQSTYEEIKSILPELFLNELRAGVGG